jgi:hypothetical protein
MGLAAEGARILSLLNGSRRQSVQAQAERNEGRPDPAMTRRSSRHCRWSSLPINYAPRWAYRRFCEVAVAQQSTRAEQNPMSIASTLPPINGSVGHPAQSRRPHCLLSRTVRCTAMDRRVGQALRQMPGLKSDRKVQQRRHGRGTSTIGPCRSSVWTTPETTP